MTAVAAEADGEPVLGQVVGQPEPSPVEEPPAPVLGVVVYEGMERAYVGTARGSVVSLGRGLLSTEEISGDYWAACICAGACPIICSSMTVVPHGPDTIETWRTDCLFFPPFIGPVAEGGVRTRNPGTNKFGGTTFSADGTAKQGDCGGFIKRPDSQKRTFQKVDARDLAGKWCGCNWAQCFFCYTTKKALDQDRYEESGRCCCLIPISETRSTRKYVHGHPTNGFDGYDFDGQPVTHWYRDPGCAQFQHPFMLAKKLC